MRSTAVALALALVLAAAGAEGLGAQPVAGTRAAPPYRLVYHALSGPGYQIFSVDPRTGRRAQLTFGHDGASTPVPSPDGRRIAYVRNPQVGDLEDRAISVMRPDGSGQQWIDRGVNVCGWTADSRAVLYWRQTESRLWIRRLDGSPPRVYDGLSYDGVSSCPLFRQDGRASLRIVSPALTLVLSVGGRQRAIADSVNDAAWSPSGDRFAYRTADGVTISRADGTLVRLLTGTTGFAWSPDGRRLALLRGWGPDARLVIHTLSGGAEATVRGGTGAASVHWSPDGVLAFVPIGASTVQRVVPGGARRLAAHRWLGAVGWARNLRGARYRPPDPALPHVRAGEVRALWTIEPLAAEGSRALFGAWDSIGSWVAPSRSVERADAETTCRAALDGRVVGAAVTRGRTAWTRSWPGNAGHVGIYAQRGSSCVLVADGRKNAGDVPGAGWLLGGGGSIVFATARSALVCRAASCRPNWTSTIWRVTDSATGTCPSGEGEPGPCEPLAAYDGRAQPMAVDAARVVVRAPDGDLEVLALDGRLLYTLPLSDAEAWDAALSDGRLLVALRGRLEVFDAATGTETASTPLPDVTPCSSADPLCPPESLQLAGTAAGLVAYVAEDTLHLLGLRDRADRSLGAVVAARLTDAGLFVSVEGADRLHGRLRFSPLASLPLQ